MEAENERVKQEIQTNEIPRKTFDSLESRLIQ